ncbi:hypothetical protein PF004_g30576, partial [Phytophthora fragariae]
NYLTRPATENENPNETSEDVNENPSETSEDVNENPSEASEDANENPSEMSEDVNENPCETSADVKETPYETSADVSKYPYEASEDANETPNETSEDVSENPYEGGVNAARLESQPNVSVRHITIVYGGFGLGRSSRRRTDLKEGTTSSDAREPPQRGESQVERETEPALSTLDDDATIAYRERMGSVTECPSEREVEALKPLDPEGPGPPLSKKETNAVANPECASLFAPDELDALEAGRPSPATEVKEEYDKELNERQFPLDEVALKKKMMITNAAKEKSPVLGELSSLPNLSVETLACTPGELSVPEYWSTWYRRTLAASESESSDDRDVGGGGHVCEITGLHSGGLVPVGESPTSDRSGRSKVAPMSVQFMLSMGTLKVTWMIFV